MITAQRLLWVDCRRSLKVDIGRNAELVNNSSILLQMEQVHAWIEVLANALEIAGVLIIVAGVVLATAWFLQGGRSSGDWRSAYERYRANLGRGILLGLELLVGADIIGTITAPLTFTSVGLLAIIVLIRTFLSFSLETEIEGCLPWRRQERQPNGNSNNQR